MSAYGEKQVGSNQRKRAQAGNHTGKHQYPRQWQAIDKAKCRHGCTGKRRKNQHFNQSMSRIRPCKAHGPLAFSSYYARVAGLI